MSGVEEALKNDFPEATEAECKRFVRACQDDKKDADAVKEEAEKLLENYLDWRSCYGLDYSKTEDANDSGDWQYAIKKALEVEESMKRAKELEKKLAEEEAKTTKEEKVEVNYDIEFSDSQKEGDDKPSETEDGKEESKPEEGASNEEGNSAKAENPEDDIMKSLLQFIFLHKSKDGTPIKDKNGHYILHVLPAMINRQKATAETYGLALTFYLDRKFDRSSEEKMTVFLDARGGEGWPNPRIVMMANFVRKLAHIVEVNNPERFETFIIAPVPWFAMSVWGAIKRVFRYGFIDSFVLIPGPSGKNAPLPREILEDHIDGEVLSFAEQFRLDNFKPIVREK